jgi:ArsR family transcriptional regulator, arsenate/arsenite/antimonite-responsive transcriptional repressor
VDDSKLIEAIPVEVIEGATILAERSQETAPPLSGVELLAVISDPVRWRLLDHLADGQTACVCELQPITAVAGNLLSYHLKVLREAGLVTAVKRGRWVDYTIATDALDRLHSAIPASRGAGTELDQR